MNVGARPSMLKGELVSENSGKEPVKEGLVIVNVGARPSMLRGELVRVSHWAHGAMAGWRRGLSWSNS